MIPVYIGYDPVEEGAFWVCAASIQRRSSLPIQIIPLNKRNLPFNRERDPKQSNEFAITRFLVPMLQKYQGHAIFVDCDFLFFGDIAELWALRDADKAVQVCKHKGDTFKAGKKYLGTEQTVYDKKCWSSLMLFNCRDWDCFKLTNEYVQTAPGLDLHQFKWTKEEKIGELPLEWNWLVGHYPPKPEVKAVHFTEGGPYFREYANCDYAAQWNTEADQTRYIKQLNS